MKIFITGGTGFIGSHLVGYLAGSKAERELGMHYTPIRQALADAVANP